VNRKRSRIHPANSMRGHLDAWLPSYDGNVTTQAIRWRYEDMWTRSPRRQMRTRGSGIRDFALRSELRAVGYSDGLRAATGTTGYHGVIARRIVSIAHLVPDWSSHSKSHRRDLEMPNVVHRRQRKRPKNESSRSSVGVESSSVIVIKVPCGDGDAELMSDGYHTVEVAEC
jgi:hypothetical protein